MNAARLRLRADLRGQWASWALIALLIGLAGGAALTAAAGARRTDTAYPRFLAASTASDVVVSPQNTGVPSYYAALARLPDVRTLGTVAGLNAFPVQALPLRANDPAGAVVISGSLDGLVGVALDRPNLVAGRLFRPDQAEAVVDEDSARILHLRVGSQLDLAAFTNNQGPRDLSQARRLSVRVVGIITGRTKVVVLTRLDGAAQVFVTPKVVADLGPDYFGYDAAYVRLQPGASPEAFGQQARALAAQYPETAQPGFGAGSNGSSVFVLKEADEVARIEQTIRPQALALGLFALVAGVAAWFIIGQVVSRQLFLASLDHPTLRALGMSRGQLVTIGLAKVGLAALAGGLLAVVGAVAASPLTPIGPARLAEPHPGVELNLAVLGLGFVVIVLAHLARAAWPAWHLAAGPESLPGQAGASGTDRPSALGRAAERVGLPASATVGLHMALEPGRGRTAVPVRTTLLGTALSIATVAAALTFGANLVRLVHTPRLYGQTWDLAVDGQFVHVPSSLMTQLLRSQPGAAAWSFGNYGDITIGGQEVSAIGIAGGSGPPVFPALLEGRAPAGPDEVVLGTQVLHRTHRRVGQDVSVTVNGQPVSMRIVGRAVFPAFGRGVFTTTDLGEGAAVFASVLAQPDASAPADAYNFVLARFAPGPARAAQMTTFLDNLAQSSFHCTQDNGNCQVFSTQPPTAVLNYVAIERTPVQLAVLLALLAAITLTQLMVTSVRRRSRDLAVLKTLGFLRRQISASVAWQASVLAAFAALAGLPLGAAAGRWAWRLFASQVGVAPSLALPWPTLMLVGTAAIVVANLVSFLPGRRAGRVRPSEALRAE